MHQLNKREANGATTSAEGNIEYWVCSDCGKYFKDSEGRTEILKADTVIPKLTHTDPIALTNLGYNSNQNGIDGTPIGAGASAATAEKAITTSTSEEGPKGSKFGVLALRSSKETPNSIKLTWNRVSGAKKYVIYGNACDKKNKFKKIALVTGKTYNVKKATKVLKKGTYYKFMVVALDENNTVKSTSKVAHIATKGGKLGNHKSIKTAAKKNKLSLKDGKRFKLKAKAIAASKNHKISKHVGIRYESTNPRVAEVNLKGVITAKGKGKCTVYVYAQNGVYKAIKIRVK